MSQARTVELSWAGRVRTGSKKSVRLREGL